MAKRSSKKRNRRDGSSSPGVAKRRFENRLLTFGLPLLLAAVAFAIYLPSLQSGLVYDARFEILEEGYVTSLANLPAVLSLKVLGMNLLLADRPGQILFLMLNAALWGKEPWGYHLMSNLVLAAIVALLFLLLRRLVATGMTEPGRAVGWKIQMALVAVTLVFALHPVSVESVAAVGYDSDLLVTLFTLLTLMAATFFRPENQRSAFFAGSAGVCCAMAAVMCKESGLAASLLLVAYWVLFRRGEKRRPWLLFCGGALGLSFAFLAARFHFGIQVKEAPHYLGGSLGQVFLIQPRLWVFMMGKLLWPTQLSADYTLENIVGLQTGLAVMILLIVLAGQAWLGFKSRLGALGVLTFWAGLLTVSNFMPLYRIMADRFYYLPLAGVAMQLLALFIIVENSRWRYGLMLAVLLAALLPFTVLTWQREKVFATEYALWSDTVRVSPYSSTAHNDLGMELFDRGQIEEAKAHWEKALALDPNDPDSHNNMGMALLADGKTDEAAAEHQKALAINPYDSATHNNLGIALFHEGKVDEAVAQYQEALEIKPDFVEAHYDLGNALLQKGQIDEAIAQYQKALDLRPGLAQAECNMGSAYLQKGNTDEAVAHYRDALAIDPQYADARNNLDGVLAQKAKENDAMARFQELLKRNNQAKTPSPP
jgi:tetratricopeptide (TPR) repeat protein